MNKPEERLCPLCGGDNRCAMAKGEPAETCWCQGEELSADALAAIPADAAGKRCICPGCGLEWSGQPAGEKPR